MSIRSIFSGALATGVWAILGCGADSMGPPEHLSILANRETGGAHAQYSWHAGDDLLAQAGVPGPDVAGAANGDILEVTGTGTLSLHLKSITGSGTFVHKNAAGSVLGSGTWTATTLESFQSYGPSPDFPASFRAGTAVMRIRLLPAGGGAGIDGMLQLGCILPGGEADDPGSAFEGVKVSVTAGPNFNRVLGNETLGFSPTLFIAQ